MRSIALLSTVVLTAASLPARAADFDVFGAAEQDLVAPVADATFIFEFEIGGGGEMAPSYEGATTYKWGLMPIVDLHRLRIPGLIDIGGDDGLGFSISPAFDVVGERKVADNPELAGLNDVEATYALGARVGYDFRVTDQIVAGVFGELLYGFGGSQGLLGKVGAQVTAELSSEFEITGAVIASFANESYMDTYFSVTAAEAGQAAGHLTAYDPTAGLKSVSLEFGARYEFIPDTFLNANASYTQLTGSAATSPISQSANDGQFRVGLGLSRKFGVSF